jgi:hypothetical protein
VSLTLTILDLQARLKSLEVRLDALARQASQPARPAPVGRSSRKPKRKRKSQ